jgi:predicted transcriptional regulator
VTDNLIPEDIRRFIGDYVASVQQLEVLLLLCHRPEKTWTAEEVAKELKIGLATAANRLIVLMVKGLVTVNEGPIPSYSYNIRNQSACEMVSRLSDLYQSNRMQIIDIISAKAENDLRNISDAFKFRKERENG